MLQNFNFRASEQRQHTPFEDSAYPVWKFRSNLCGFAHWDFGQTSNTAQIQKSSFSLCTGIKFHTFKSFDFLPREHLYKQNSSS